MTPGLRLRPAVPGDLPACERVWRLGIDDYNAPMRVPAVPLENPGLRRLHVHTLATDPERFWVATRAAEGAAAGGGVAAAGGGVAGDEEVVAFGAAVQRGPLWFLSMLFVLPGLQGGKLHPFPQAHGAEAHRGGLDFRPF